MNMITDVAATLFVLARRLVAAFGCVCLVVNVFLPCAARLRDFLVVYVPEEWANWRLYRAQKAELRRLEARIEVLQERIDRRTRAKHVSDENAEEKQVQPPSHRPERPRVQRTTRPVVTDENLAQPLARSRHTTAGIPLRQQEPNRSTRTENPVTTHAESKRSEGLSRKPNRPLQLLSPNALHERRHVSAYVKASKGITKPLQKVRTAPSNKSRVLSLGDIFHDEDQENHIEWGH